MREIDETQLLGPIERKTIAEQVLERLSGLIREGVWLPGERLPAQRELCEMLGVGRSSMREALKGLEFMGLVEVRQGEGTFMTKESSRAMDRAIARAITWTKRDVVDLIEARQVIESELARLAAQRIEASELDQLKEHLEAMVQSLDQPESFVKADLGFHICLAEAAHNRILFHVFLTVRELLQYLIGQALAVPGTSEAAAAAHARIVEAVERRDAQGASEAMRAHLEDVKQRVIRLSRSDSLGSSRGSSS